MVGCLFIRIRQGLCTPTQSEGLVYRQGLMDMLAAAAAAAAAAVTTAAAAAAVVSIHSSYTKLVEHLPPVQSTPSPSRHQESGGHVHIRGNPW